MFIPSQSTMIHDGLYLDLFYATKIYTIPHFLAAFQQLKDGMAFLINTVYDHF